MRYTLLGLSLALTTLLALWVLLTSAGRLVWRLAQKTIAQLPPQTRAHVLFGLQVGPLLGALLGVLGVVLPAYLLHEPPGTNEPYSLSLLFPSLVCLLVLSFAAHRVWLAWRLTNRLSKSWQQGMDRIKQDGIAAPIWRIQHPLPLLAVVGVLRPQLFVAAHLFEALTTEELTAVLRHEQWHLTARDNFRRVLFDLCQHGLFFLRGGRELAQQWYESVEMSADEYAARHNPHVALDLASALVKIARLFPAGASVTLPATVSTVLLDDSSLARRVQRLMQMSDEGEPFVQRSVWPGVVTGCLLLFALIMLQSDALWMVHQGIELLVSYLP